MRKRLICSGLALLLPDGQYGDVAVADDELRGRWHRGEFCRQTGSAAGEKSVGARMRFRRGRVWTRVLLICSPRGASCARHLSLKGLQGDGISRQQAMVEAPGDR